MWNNLRSFKHGKPDQYSEQSQAYRCNYCPMEIQTTSLWRLEDSLNWCSSPSNFKKHQRRSFYGFNWFQNITNKMYEARLRKVFETKKNLVYRCSTSFKKTKKWRRLWIIFFDINLLNQHWCCFWPWRLKLWHHPI